MKFLKIFVLVGSLTCSHFAFCQDAPKDVTEEKEPKKAEFKISEVITLDSVPSSEFLKRAVNWVQTDNPRYVKTSGVTTGNKVECKIVFKVRPKELNPQPDYTGTITMHVSIECKDNKYRYIINKVKHTSTSGKASGGDITNPVPDCGSMVMNDLTWKKLRGEAIKYANSIASEIKSEMFKPSSTKKDDW